MPEEFEKRVVDLLSRFAPGEPMDTRNLTEEESATAEWLLDNGFLSGSKYKLISGECDFSNLQITRKGLEHLKQVAEALEAGNSRERAYSSKHPMRAQVVVGVVTGLLLAAAFTYIAWFADNGFPWRW